MPGPARRTVSAGDVQSISRHALPRSVPMDKLFAACDAVGTDGITLSSLLAATRLGEGQFPLAQTLEEANTMLSRAAAADLSRGAKRPAKEEEERELGGRLPSESRRSAVMGQASLHSALTAIWDALRKISSGHGSASAWTDAFRHLLYAEAALALSEQCSPDLEGREESVEKCSLLIAAAPAEVQKVCMDISTTPQILDPSLNPNPQTLNPKPQSQPPNPEP